MKPSGHTQSSGLCRIDESIYFTVFSCRKLCPKGNVYQEYENFIKNFDIKHRTDENIVLIMCAISLFSQDRPNVNLVHTDVIRMEQVILKCHSLYCCLINNYSQNSYYFLLRRYLESIYDGCEARSVFLNLLRKLQEVRKLNEGEFFFN